MGDIYRISCPECGSLWEVRTGCGMIHGRRENVLAEFSKNDREKAESIYPEDKILGFSFVNALCERCGGYTAVPVLSDNIAGKVLFTGSCPECGSKNVRIKDKPEDEMCPACKKTRPVVTYMGHWD